MIALAVSDGAGAGRTGGAADARRLADAESEAASPLFPGASLQVSLRRSASGVLSALSLDEYCQRRERTYFRTGQVFMSGLVNKLIQPGYAMNSHGSRRSCGQVV